MNDLLSGSLTSVINSGPAESYVIGAVMSNNALLDDLSQITPDMFQDTSLRSLWKRMKEMRAENKPVDLSALFVEASDQVDRIGTDKLINLQSMYMGPATVPYYVEKLVEIHVRRKIIQGSAELQKRASDPGQVPVDELKSDFERIGLEFSKVPLGNGLQDGADVVVDWLSNLETRYKNPNTAFGMMTGWGELDKKTLGWQRKDLIVVGGRTSVGKTAFSLENLIRIQRAGYKVAMFSLEMSAEQVRNRIIGNLASVRLPRIRTGRMGPDEFEAVTDPRWINVLSNIAIDDTRGITTDYIVSEMRRWKRTRGLDFVVVDYLQEIQEQPKPNDNTGSALGRIVRKLRKSAMECDCAVMALSQLNREADGRPQLSHLSGSSGIESAADVVALLSRDKDGDPKTLEINLAKQRNGPTAEIELYYDPSLQKIDNLSDRREVS